MLWGTKDNDGYLTNLFSQMKIKYTCDGKCYYCYYSNCPFHNEKPILKT